MQVKTKFFSLLFAFALIIPCFFILTACGEGGNEPELKANEITISVSDKVYDGQAIAVTATATSGAAPIVRYKLAGADDSTYSATAPKNVGQYVVGAGLEATDEWAAAVKTAEFSITAKEVGLNWTAPQNLVYNGQAKVPTVAATGLVAGDTCTINAALTATKDNVNVGSFTFTASGVSNNNYKLPANAVSAQYTITKKVLSNLETTVTYNGSNSHTIDLSNDVEQGLAVVVTFESANVGAEPTGAVLTGAKAGNYQLDETTCDVSIVKKEIGLSWTAPADLNYDEQAKVPTVVATGLIQGDSCEVNASLTDGKDNVNVIPTGFTYTATGVLNANYKLPQNVISPIYRINPMEINVNENFEYNGQPTFTKDLSSVKAGLTIDVWFDGSDVGEGVDYYEFKLNGVETNNYAVDEFCVEIVQKEVGLQWTAPANLAYNEQAKVPTVVATGLVAGDTCTVDASLTQGNDNVNDGSFTFTATGLSNANYKLPEIVTSDSYDITIASATVGTELDLMITPTTFVDYFKVTLAAGNYYYFTFVDEDQGDEPDFTLYQKGTLSTNPNAIVRNTEWLMYPTSHPETDETPFLISETGVYYVKVADSCGHVTINLDDHTDIDNYGFCTHCGRYQGRSIGIDEEITGINLAPSQKAFFRFRDPGDVQLKRIKNAAMAAQDFKYYRTVVTDDHYSFVDINATDPAAGQFDGDFKDHITSADGWYYIVITPYNSSNINAGSFTIVDDHTVANRINELGICTVSHRYVGETYDEDGTTEYPFDIAPNLGADETGYYRVYVPTDDPSCNYTITESIVDNAVGFFIYYYDTDGVLQAGTIGTAINAASVDDDDPYIYITVVNTSEPFLSSEKVRITLS